MGNVEGLHAMQSKKHFMYRPRQPLCHKIQITIFSNLKLLVWEKTSRTMGHRERHWQILTWPEQAFSPHHFPPHKLPGTACTPFPFCWVESELLRYVTLTMYSLRLAQRRDFLLLEQGPAKKDLDCSHAVPRKAGTIPPTGLWQQGRLKWFLCKLQLTAAEYYHYSKLGLTPCAGSLHPSCPPNP